MVFNYKITPFELQLGIKRVAVRDNLTFLILGGAILVYGLIKLAISSGEGLRLPLILAFMGFVLITLSLFRIYRVTSNARKIFRHYKQDYEMEYELSLDDEFLINKRIDATKAVGKYERYFVVKIFYVKDFLVIRMYDKSNLLIPCKYISQFNRIEIFRIVKKTKKR